MESHVLVMPRMNPYLDYPGVPFILDAVADADRYERTTTGTRLRLGSGQEYEVPADHHFDMVDPTVDDLLGALVEGTAAHALMRDERRRWHDAKEHGLPYGLLAYFPEPNHLVQYPPRQVWELAQSISSGTLYRDFGLDGSFDDMRRAIRGAVPAVAGCSVGWRMIEGLALYRVGWLKVSDRKAGHPRGNNRSPHSYSEMLRHRSKAHSVATRLHAIDPLTPISVYGAGITRENADDFVAGNPSLGEPRATIVFDEIDHLPTKLLLRSTCRRHHVTYAMITDIGPCSLVEVRDFEKQPDLPLVHGLSDQDAEAMLARLEQHPTDPRIALEAIMALVGGPENVRGEINDIVSGRRPPLTTSVVQDGSTCLFGGVLAPRLLLQKLAGRSLPMRQLLDPLAGVIRREG